MSGTIEERVLEMRFENGNFESNVSQSMSTLEKLKAALRLDGSSKSFDGLSKSIKGVNFNPLTSGVDTVKARFSALDVMAVTALANITNSAVNAGKRIVSALTIDPIKTGFQEYETQINSVQTILANTQKEGTNIAQVNKALDELNHYADMTIYNFTEMTRNIGTFTAAGVGLQDSVDSIKGIANLAAVSGSTSQQASTAMYQLSQALASGTVKLQDWNSVVNAGMGGQVFQDALKRTATQMGTNVDQLIEKYGTFRESLSQGKWLTTDVLTETLKQFAGAYTEAELIEKGYTEQQAKDIYKLGQTAVDAATKVKTFTQLKDTLTEAAQSGWAQSWRIIIGDFEQAKNLWTEASDFFGGAIEKMSTARNELLTETLMTKWDQFSSTLTNAGVDMDSFQSKLTETLAQGGVSLDDLILKYGNLDQAIASGKVSTESIVGALKQFDTASVSAGKAITDIDTRFVDFQNNFDKVVKGTSSAEDKMKDLVKMGFDTAKAYELVNEKGQDYKLTLGDLTDAQLKNLDYTDDQILGLRGVAEQAEKAGTPLNNLIEAIQHPHGMSGRELIIDTIRNSLKSVTTVLGAAREAWYQFFKPIQASTIYSAIDKIHTVSEKVFNALHNNADNIRASFAGIVSVLDLVRDAFSFAFRSAGKIVSALFDGIGGLHFNILNLTAGIGNMLVRFHDWIESNETLKTVANGLVDGIVAVITQVKEWVKAFMELPQVQEFIENFKEAVVDTAKQIGKYVTEAIDKLKQLDKITLNDIGSGFQKLGRKIKDNLLNGFQDLEPGNLLGNFSDKFREFVGQGIDAPLKSTGGTIRQFSEKALGHFGKLGQAINDNIGMGEIFTMVWGGMFAVTMHKTGTIANKVIKAFTDWMGPLQAIHQIGMKVAGFIGEMTMSLKRFSRAVSFNFYANGILKIAAAMGIMAASVYALSSIKDKGDLYKATAVIIGLAAALTLISRLGGSGFSLTKGKGLFGEASLKGTVNSLISMALAIAMLAGALKIIQGMEWKDIGKGLLTIGAMMAGMAAFGIVMSKYAKTMPKIGASFVGMAIAIGLMVGAMKELDRINFKHLGKDLIALGAIVGSLIGLSLTTRAMKGGWKSGFGMAGIAAAVFVMAKAVDAITKIDMKAVKENFDAFGLVFGSLIGMMAVSKLSGKYAASAGAGIFLMATSLLVIGQAIKMIAGIPQTDVTTAMGTIEELFLIFGALTAISGLSGAGAAKAGVMIGLMSLSLMALVPVIGALAVIGRENPDGLLRAVAAIDAIFVAMGAVVGFSGLSGKAKVGPIVAMTVAMGMLIGALGGLAMIKPERLREATLSLSLVMSMFSVMEVATGMMGNIGKGGIASILSMAGAIAALAGVFVALDKLNVDNTFENAKGLSLTLGTMTGCLAILSRPDTLLGAKTAFISLSAMAGVVAEVAAIFVALNKLNVDVSLEQAAGLSLMLGTMTGVLTVLSLLGQGKAGLIEGAAYGLAGLAVVVGGITGLIVALGAGFKVLEHFHWEDVVEKGVMMFEKVGNALGKLVGGAVAGFNTAVSNGQMESMMTGLKTFIDGMAGLDPANLKTAKTITGLLKDLGEYNLTDSIGNILGGSNDPETLKTQMGAIGEGLTAFSASLEGFNYDPKKMGQVTDCMEKLSGVIQAMNPSGGGKGLIFGDSYNSFGTIVDSLIPMADGLDRLSEVFGGKDFDLSSMDQVYPILENLNRIIGGMEKFGVWQFLSGSKIVAFDELVDQLSNLGEGLSAYSNNLGKGFNADTVMNSVAPLESIINAVGNIYSAGGLKAAFAGSKNMGLKGFIEQLGDLGTGLHDYVEGLNGTTDFSAVSASGPALQSLVMATSGIFSAGGLDKLNGDKAGGLKALGQNLGAIGEGLGTYAKGIAGADFSNVGASVTALTQLSDFIANTSNFSSGETRMDQFGNSITKMTNVSEFGTGIDTFATSIGKLGEALAGYSNSLGGANFDVGQIEQTIGVLNKFKQMSIDLQASADESGDASSSFQGLTDALPKLAESLSGLATAVPDVSAFETTAASLTTMKTAFEGLGSIDVSGIDSIKSSLESLSTMSFDTFSTSISTMATSLRQAMTNMTIDVALGAAGIVTALQAMGTQMQSAVSTGMANIVSKVSTTMSMAAAAVRVGASTMSNAMRSAMAGMAAAVIAGAALVGSAIRSMMSAAASTISSYTGAFRAAGTALAMALAMGFTVGGHAIAAAARSAAAAGARAAAGAAGSFVAAGVACGAGFAAGLRSQVGNARAAGAAVGNAGAQGARSAAKVSSPSKVFMGIGNYCVQGFAIGLRDNAYKASDASANMANGVIGSFCDVMKINSPSLKMNELGHYVVEGLADGITEDMKPEEAMAKKAENIVNAFKTKLDEIDLDIKTAELINELWKVSNVNAEEKIINEKTAEFLEEKIKLQEEATKAAEDEYAFTKESITDQEKIQEAYNKMLQEQIDLQKLRNELEETYGKIKNNNYKSDQQQKLLFDTWNKKYLEELKAAKELVEQGWITQEQADISAKEAAERYTGVLFENLFPNMEDVKWRGGQVSENLADGMAEKKEVVSDAATDISEGAVVAAGEMTNEMYAVGQNLGQALADGMRSKMNALASAATGLSKTVVGQTESDLEINSPSRVFMRIGEYLSEGLAEGITSASGRVINSLSGLSGRIGRAIESDSNFRPSISPVIDTSRLTAANMAMMPTFNSMFTVPNNEWNQKMYDAQKEFMVSNERVVSAVEDLRNDLNTIYAENSGEVSLYVDSMKLASTIAKPMNRQLGVLSKRGSY